MVLGYIPEWPLHTRWPFFVFFLGWWLIEQTGVYGRPLCPRPSIFMSPTGIVRLGEDVTIHCKYEGNEEVSWYLNKYRDKDHLDTAKTTKKQSTVVGFPMTPKLSDAGWYSCRYCENNACRHHGNHCSDFSNIVCVNITDPKLTKPSIKMTLRVKSALGLNVTITCEGPKNGLVFALFKSREQITFKPAEQMSNMTMFPVFMERPEDALNYSCRYHLEENSFVWSEPSDPEELKMEGESVILWASIAAGLLLLFLLSLLVAFVLHRKRRRGTFVKEEIQTVDKPSEYLGGEDPNEVSYAVLNHQSLKVKQTTSPDTVSESCVYATVVKG